jgi:peptidoglycan/xylan/chitin deacetylase (PgdA/CDA1 family)
MTPSCLVAVSIDVECDKDERWDVKQPLSFDGVEDGVGKRLTPLFRQYGVRPTYLVSSEVMRHGGSAALLKAASDCELGTHLHPEFIVGFEGVKQTAAVACQMSGEDERRDLELLTALFAGTFDKPPRSYRAGRYGASARSIRLLAELGYEVDTSVTPHKLWDYGLDFRGAPDSPYYPSAGDISRAGPPGGLLEIPISLRPSPAPAFVRGATQLLARTRIKPTRDLAKWARGPFWFRPGWSKRGVLLGFVRSAAGGEYQGILNMMFHNVDMVPGCSPNACSEEAVRNALDDLRAVCEEVAACGGRFATLSEIRDTQAQAWTSL